MAREGKSRYPANTITWHGANEFVKWLSKDTGLSFRLPTEVEWEGAARTNKGQIWPTGGEPRPIDPQTSAPRAIRVGGNVEIDALPDNVTETGLYHTINGVGDWTSSEYKMHEKVPLLADAPDGYVLKRCLNVLTERSPALEVGPDGCYGLRILLEADETGNPLVLKDVDKNERGDN